MRWLDGINDSMDVSLGELRGVGDGWGGLACCDSWGRKELNTLSMTEMMSFILYSYCLKVLAPSMLLLLLSHFSRV